MCDCELNSQTLGMRGGGERERRGGERERRGGERERISFCSSASVLAYWRYLVDEKTTA
jgi:hypothetical protein